MLEETELELLTTATEEEVAADDATIAVEDEATAIAEDLDLSELPPPPQPVNAMANMAKPYLK